MVPVPKRPVPWRLGDLLALYSATALGAILILVGWVGASGTARLGAQVVWVNVGIAGILLAGIGNVAWLRAGRRRLAERGRALFGTASAAVPGELPAPSVDETFVAGDRMTKYHRPDCLLAAGKAVRRARRDAHERAGLTPCGVCRP